MTRRHPHCGLFSCKDDRQCVFPRDCIGPKVEARLVPLDLPPELAKVVDRDPYSKLADFIRDPATSTADRIGAASKLLAAPYGASHLADADKAQAARLKADIASFGETAWRVEGESCDWTIPTKRH